MNRRRFFELMGWAVAAPVAYSFLGTGSVYVPSSKIEAVNITLAEWAKQHSCGDGRVMARLLSQTNEILEDMVFKPGKLPPIRMEAVLPESKLIGVRPGMTYVRELRPDETLGDYIDDLATMEECST